MLYEGASDISFRDEFDITTRMQKRVTETDGRQSLRARHFSHRTTDINSQQLSSSCSG